MNGCEVEYITHSGDDLLVVNAARVSFNKRKEVFEESDEKLIRYLARHKHWTPFAHPSITLRIKAPIFVRTQLFKHKQGFIENEVSRRYVNDPPEIFYPEEGWRKAPEGSMKQGSGDLVGPLSMGYADLLYNAAIREANIAYSEMLRVGVCPEQARMVLPQATMTEWFWTGSLAAYARVYFLRSDPDAQKETRDIALKISNIIQPLFPVSWKYLNEEKDI